MGVKVERILNERKGNSVITTVASGAVTSPVPFSIAIVTMLEGADINRLEEIQDALIGCIEYARENALFVGSGTTSFITTLSGGKRATIVEGVASNIVTGQLGIMIHGTVRNQNKTGILETAYKQLIDFMREQGRLGV
jgi:hypothetical protein